MLDKMKINDGYERERIIQKKLRKDRVKMINEKFSSIKATDHMTYIHINKKDQFWKIFANYIMCISDNKIDVWEYGYLDIAKKIGKLLKIHKIIIHYTDDLN